MLKISNYIIHGSAYSIAFKWIIKKSVVSMYFSKSIFLSLKWREQFI